MRRHLVWAALLSLGTVVTLGLAQERGGFGPAGDLFNPGRVPRPTRMPIQTATPAEPLPADAQALVGVFNTEAAAIRAKAEQEIQGKELTLIVALQALQDAYTRDAKLDEAVAIRDTIRRMKTAHLKTAPDPGSLDQYATRIGETFYFDVTGQTGYPIWGSEVYTCDSHLATAAVHAGVLKSGQRGIVKVTMVKSPESHTGSTSNGVTSANWGSFSASYTVERAITDRAPTLSTKPSAPKP